MRSWLQKTLSRAPGLDEVAGGEGVGAGHGAGAADDRELHTGILGGGVGIGGSGRTVKAVGAVGGAVVGHDDGGGGGHVRGEDHVGAAGHQARAPDAPDLGAEEAVRQDGEGRGAIAYNLFILFFIQLIGTPK